MERRKPFLTSLVNAPRRRLRFDRGESIHLVDEENGRARNVDIHVNTLEPNSGPGPQHYHERAENIYVVLDGSIDVEVEGEVHHLVSDDVLFIPPGLVHGTSNPGRNLARFIEVYAPAGHDFHIVEQEEAT